MADQTETILLEFVVDQGAAEKQLEKIEGILIDNKKAQQELSKAYKAGVITQEEYVKENIRLQQNIKKEQQQKATLIKTINTESNSRNALRQQISALVKEYDSLNQGSAKGVQRGKELEAQISKLSSQLTKGDKAAGLFKNQIGNYPEAFKQAAGSIQIAGTSVDQIGAKLASFANPATAAVGIVTALGAAYARSTIGAKDLEFAQNQLSAGVTILTNNFASLFSSAEDGKGFFSQITDEILFRLSPALSITTKLAAANLERLQDLQRDEIGIRDDINERLSENQELLSEIADEQTSLNRQLQLAGDIRANILNNQSDLVDILTKELDATRIQLGFDQENEALQTAVLQKEKEISKAKLDTNKKLKANDILQSNINDKIRDQIRLEAELASKERSAEKRASSESVDNTQTGIDSITLATPTSASDTAIKGQKELADNLLKINKDYYDKDIQFKKAATEIKQALDYQAIMAAADIAGQAASIFEEQTVAYKVLASAQTIISTYSSATKSYDALADIPYVGPALGAAAAAVAIASGLANLAKINGVEFAEGGYTGDGGKYEPKGIVHGGEMVWNKRDVAMAGGPAAANAMRPTVGLKGYADGGFVTNQNISSTQQALITANALKNLPPVVASWTEGRAVGRRVEFREKLSRL